MVKQEALLTEFYAELKKETNYVEFVLALGKGSVWW